MRLTKKEKEQVIEFMYLISSSVAMRGSDSEEEIEDNKNELEGYNLLARKLGLREIEA